MKKVILRFLKRVTGRLARAKDWDMILFLLFIFYWGVGAGCAISIMMDSTEPAIWGYIALILLVISAAWIKELNRVWAIKE